MKNRIVLFVFLFCIYLCNAQTPVSFYPSFVPSAIIFGYQVDLDGNEIIVSNRDGVYVFDKNANGIQQKQFIEPPFNIAGLFGFSISIDNSVLAIGDPFLSSSAPNSGSVYIYRKNSTAYELEQVIPSPDIAANYYFGSCVKVFGNKLFITADVKVAGNDASTNVGSVYYYIFDGTEWVFQQKLTSSNFSFLGKKIEVNNDILVVYGRNSGNTSQSFIWFKLIYNNYAFQGTNGYAGIDDNFDFSLSENNIYSVWNNAVNITQINADGTSTSVGYFDIPPSVRSDFILGKITADNENIFIGSTGYILQMMRKFPVLHYKKIANTWNFQTSYFGTGAVNEDDYFGYALVNKGNSLIIGAPEERVQIPYYGNAYYLDYALATNQFESNGFSLFPNPTNDRVFVNNNNSLSINKIEIYSVSGKSLQTQIDNFSEISLENFASGLYFAKIYAQSDVSQTFKIVKN